MPGAARSIPKHRATVVGAAAIALLATACASPATTVAPRRQGSAPPPVATVPTTAPEAPGPWPIAIPPDPYAPEPVVAIGTMEIPRLGLVHRIYDGVTLHNIDLGPSHWPGSAVPGQPGNAVFAGHRVSHDHPFRHLDQLVAGDRVVFVVNGVRSTYRVTGDLVVSPSDTWIAHPTPTPTATLYACHPPGSATQRFVVRLELVT
jgi:sortase A